MAAKHFKIQDHEKNFEGLEDFEFSEAKWCERRSAMVNPHFERFDVSELRFTVTSSSL